MIEREPIVGIDLGTTNSAIAWFDNGRVRFFENSLGDVLTQSVVALDPRTDTFAVGRTAKDILARKPHLAAALFKRNIGDDRTFKLGERTMTPVELSAYVLDQLRTDAEQALGRTVDRCVVTVPAYFNDSQRFSTRQAAEMAGFRVERVLNEPTAAAIAYGLHQRDAESRFLVFDLGGGTFDVCVMELFEGLLEVRSVAGESQLGGEDFTLLLAQHVLKRAGIDPTEAAAQLEPFALLHKRAELLKRKLSRWPMAQIEIPEFRGQSELASLSITAEEAERAYAPLMERMLAPCRAALRGAGIERAELDEVILVGGATRMPIVRRFVSEIFGREPMGEQDPDKIVASGAAVQAALCAEDAGVDDIVVTDVCSHSLGIEVALPVGNTHMVGYFSPLIHRNTVLPTSVSEIFHPVMDFQTEVALEVYQGESRQTRLNKHVGRLEIKGLPRRGPKDDKGVQVTFTYDVDGILGVEAEILKTGKRFEKLFQRDGSGVSSEMVATVRKRLALIKERAVKPDPSQRPRFRDLLARADLLWTEVRGLERELLGEMIAKFELMLLRSDADAIDRTYAELLELCHAVDQGERW